MPIIRSLLRIILAPFRFIWRLVSGAGSRTVRKTGAGLVAQRAGDSGAGPEDDTSVLEETGGGILFERLVRPSLRERLAADLSLDEAREYVAQAEKFYTFGFSLFPRSDQFYEEVEQQYLAEVLGRADGATDANFLDIMERFRKSLNANSARLYLLYTPIMTITLLAATLFIISPDYAIPAVAGGYSEYVATGALLAVLLGVQLLLYHWPYKVTQQQNLLGLDNYVTSKFSRVNQKFQVAKRRAMNVERTKRMHQAEELKEEAGLWTISYHWLGMRLFFCEQCIRNMIYQIRRNTTLYAFGGFIFTILIVLAFSGLSLQTGLIDLLGAKLLLGVGALFTVASYLLIMRRATRDTLEVIQPREWNRFHLIDLHETIKDHVGEDKLQIVTFRDRNRLE